MKTSEQEQSIELSTLRFEALDDTGGFGLRRGFDAHEKGRILLSVATQDARIAQVLEQFERCVAISGELDPSLFVRSLAVQEHDGRPALVMHDPGGELLSKMLEGLVALRMALNVALDVAASLADFHARGFLHRDVKPSNVLVDPRSGKARLAGFRLALRMPRHRQAPEVPSRLVGTLAYMAPEQSGWTNRSIDSRSDLYSLGVVLYEMLTGKLPFTATDLAGWVHCHVARHPSPPHEVAVSVPRVVSAIVMRLLAKNPEERYQTAQGLVADLRHCLDVMTPAGSIDDFALGRRDVTRHLVVSEKIYGREREVESLLVGFDRTLERQRPTLFLVAGPSGIGKSSVVAELYKVLVPARGRFVSGKCDQYKRDIPYAALGQALRKLVSSLLGDSESELAVWRTRILDALMGSGALLGELVPELELIVGAPPPAPSMSAQEAQVLFQTVLRRFLAVFSHADHPLVLFLDDIQWLDVATMDLLAHVLDHEDSGCPLLIAAYRDNEIGPDHALFRRLEGLRAHRAVEELRLSPISLEHVTELVADTTRTSARIAAPLAAVVHEKTGGNPFFAVQFITALNDDGLLTLDAASSEWRWDLRTIVAGTFGHDVLELMVTKLARFPEATREVLGTLASFGAVATPDMLADLLSIDVKRLHTAMHEAVRAGLVRRSDADVYSFAHDRVQEAAYALVPEDERPRTHLRLGRLLLARTPPEAKLDMVFEIVNQMNRGISLLTSREERDELAGLDVLAGKRAHGAAAYDVALTYFARATELLAGNEWESQHSIAFEAEFFRAECEFLNGDADGAEARLAELAAHVTTLVEDSKVLCLRLAVASSLVRYQYALAIGLPYFARAGLPWPEQITEADIGRELARAHELVGGRPIGSLTELPMMTDPHHIASMDVLAALFGPAMFSGSIAYGLILGRAVTLSLEFGLSDAASLFFAVFGVLMMDVTKRQNAGLEWAELSLALVEQRGLRRMRAKAYVAVGHVMLWTRDLSVDSQLGARALQAGIETGDAPYAVYGYMEMTRSELARGTPLAAAERLVLNALAFSRKITVGLSTVFQYELNVIRALRGGAFDFAPYPDEAAMEAALDADPSFTMVIFLNQVRKLERNVYLERPVEALRAAEHAERYLAFNAIHFEYAELQLYGAIARAMTHDGAGEAERPTLLAGIRRNVELLREWSASCWVPTFAHRYLLAEAELARIEGRHWEAFGHYQAAIRCAQANGWLHHVALANERAARFLQSQGHEEAARAHLATAHRCYVEWGAVAKARLLEPSLSAMTESPTAASPMVEASVEQLDLDTVLRVSSALSGEIVLDKLVHKLLTIAVEHAGASRALLLLVDDAVPRVVAEAVATSTGIELSSEVSLPAKYPASIIRWVMRAQRSLVLVNPEDFAPFSSDAYLRDGEPRAVVVLPLAKQGALGGVLYLENRLAGGVFGEARVSVLKLVAAQAGIALDNARLYEELRRALDAVHRSEEQLRTTLDAVPEMTWYNRPDGGNAFQSEVWSEFTGFKSEQSQEYGWLAAIHPEDAPTVIEAWDRVRAAGEAGEVEARVRRHDGVYRWFVFRTKPRRDESGQIVMWYGNTIDIDDLKQSRSALMGLQSQLAHVSRVASLGALSASITHEVNQPLGAIRTNAEAALLWLEHQPPRPEEVSSALERINRDATRMGEVVQRLRSLFLKQDAKKVELSVNDIIEEVIELTHHDVGKHRIALRTELATGLPGVLGNQVQLQQVVLNLVGNAVQAIGPGTTGTREIVVGTRLDAGRVVVSVADTGVGFGPQDSEALFAPFQTTKPDGMGMGLSISRSIVEDHGGRIWAEVNEGGGATFQFAVPAVGECQAVGKVE